MRVVTDARDKALVEILPFSDVHLGHKHCNEEQFDRWLDYVLADRRGYVFGLGDYIEAVPGNYKIPTWDQKETPQRQVERMLDKLSRIKRRILFLLPGNHEDRITRLTSINLVGLMCRELGVPLLEYPGQVEVLCQTRGGCQESYLFAVAHGNSAAMSNHKEFEDLAKIYPKAELLCLGHDHSLRHRQGIHMPDGEPKAFQCIRTGSFLGYPGYAMKSLYMPQAVGSPRITLWCDKHQFKVHLSG